MKIQMGMFMGLMFIVGLILTIFAFNLGPKTKTCPIQVQNAARGLLVMGVAVVSISTTYLLGGCGPASAVSDSKIGMLFVVLMLGLGITVMVLASILHSKCEQVQDDTPVLITMAVIVTVFSALYLSYQGYIMMGTRGYSGLEQLQF